MKKRVLALMLLCVLFVMCFALASCGDGEAHVHTFKDTWSKDSSGHWYDATCECTDAPKNVLGHVDANNDGACDVCTYTDHTHEYAESWTADCTNHWKAASCGHIVAGIEIAPHTDNTEDGVCDTCGYVIENLHNHYYSTEWSSDGENHWHAALCEHGVEVADKAAHTINDAGYCTVCDAKIKEVDLTDIEAVLKAAVANNYKVVSGKVIYRNDIYDLNESGDGLISLSHIYNDVYFILGNGSSYVNWITVEDWGNTSEQQWFQLVDAETGEIFGVNSYDGGVTINLTDGVPEKLNGYTYLPSTLLASFDDTSTLAATLKAMYDLSKSDTAKNVTAKYNAETGTYQMAFDYIALNIVDFTDPDTQEKTTSYETSYFEVKAEFTVDESFVITSARMIVDGYQDQDFDDDYNYDVETGTITMNDNAAPNRYAYEVGQTSGERTYSTAYPKASLIPSSFDITYNGEVIEDAIEVEYGVSQNLYLDNFFPTTSGAEYIDSLEFKVVNNNAEDTYVFSPYYYGGAISFFADQAGSFTMDVIYLGNTVKTITINTVVPEVASIDVLTFVWASGWGDEWYEANSAVTSAKIMPGETLDFTVFVRPNAAPQGYTYTVSDGATVTEVELTNVMVSWENFATYNALQFSAEAEGEYTITITSTEDPTIIQEFVVTVGGDGGSTEGSGTDADPYILVENGDYVCEFPGGYNYVFYKYTATQAGTLTISVAGDDYYWGIGQSPMALNAGNSNPTQSVDLAAGASVYVGISTNSADAADMNFTVIFESTGSGEGGGSTETTPDGSESNPYELQENNTCEYPGGYAWVYYQYTAQTAGTATITVTSDDYSWSYGFAPDQMENVGQVQTGSVELEAGQTVYIGMSTNSTEAATITFTASFEASGSGEGSGDAGSGNTALTIGYNNIEAADVTYEYTAETAGTLNLSAGTAIGGMVEISYTVNGGDSTVLELGTNVDLALQAGDVVVITVTAEGYATLTATWTGTTASSNTALTIGYNNIEAADVTYEYTAETVGTLNLSAGTAIGGMVEISYTVNGGDSTVLELGTNVDLTLQAGDVVVITVTAEGYATLTATWTEGTGSDSEGETTTEPDGSVDNPYIIANGTTITIGADYYTPIYVTVNAGVTATMNEGAQFVTEADGPLGTTVTPTVDTTYMVYADSMAGAMVQIVGSTGTTEEPESNALVLGENAVYVTIENYYCAGVEVTFTATEAGTYTISAAEGEENADLYVNEEYIELPYEFTLEAGESITFRVCTLANVMTTTEDTIDLVIAKK
ncbi:MAG: hypothetical protein IJW54_04210 [Clostridia bacterium]|nr:hypothetical protein [Clostridia bacterium]